MNWEQINLKSVMAMLRHIEQNSIALDGEQAIVYSDGKEELKISYRRLDYNEETPTNSPQDEIKEVRNGK